MLEGIARECAVLTKDCHGVGVPYEEGKGGGWWPWRRANGEEGPGGVQVCVRVQRSVRKLWDGGASVGGELRSLCCPGQGAERPYDCEGELPGEALELVRPCRCPPGLRAVPPSSC